MNKQEWHCFYREQRIAARESAQEMFVSDLGCTTVHVPYLLPILLETPDRFPTWELDPWGMPRRKFFTDVIDVRRGDEQHLGDNPRSIPSPALQL